MKKKTGEYTGSSDLGLSDAIQDALQKAGEHTRIEIIETISSWINDDKRYYQVIINTFTN
ncbi:hypothetical protein [Legionella lansingensis]|nr:hypothetical protein [Legionella lansingensis]